MFSSVISWIWALSSKETAFYTGEYVTVQKKLFVEILFFLTKKKEKNPAVCCNLSCFALFNLAFWWHSKPQDITQRTKHFYKLNNCLHSHNKKQQQQRTKKYLVLSSTRHLCLKYCSAAGFQLLWCSWDFKNLLFWLQWFEEFFYFLFFLSWPKCQLDSGVKWLPFALHESDSSALPILFLNSLSYEEAWVGSKRHKSPSAPN